VVCPDANNPLAGKCVNLAEDVNNCGKCGVVCEESTDLCKVKACINGSCGFVNLPDGTLCDDGDLCTRTDTCQNGTCVGSNPVVCTALDQCHNVGTCDPATGVCSNPPKPNDTACDDGNECTVNDTCQDGACTPGAPRNCDDNNECTADTCDPATGCVHTPLPGQPCNQSNKCRTDVCNASGQCEPGPATVTCPQCHVCDPDSGTCTAVTNGTLCEDGNLCTVGDTCQNGTCQPGAAKTCPSTGNQCTESVCNKTTGACETRNKSNGTSCNDGNACTTGETCQDGACIGGTLKNCDDKNECTQDSCDPTTGICLHTPLTGTPCGMPGSSRTCCNGMCCQSGNICCSSTPARCGGGTGSSCKNNNDCCSGSCVGPVMNKTCA
jgi:hypothetical protein